MKPALDGYVAEKLKEAVAMQIAAIGDDIKRPGIGETPERVVNSWKELYSGYGVDPAIHLSKKFPVEDGGQMITCNNIEFFSMCEHHLLPFFGTVDISYISGEYACGLSKLARVVDVFARRMQMQENLTSQIASCIEEHLKPRGVAVRIRGVHMCMRARGVKQGAQTAMATTALRGAFYDPVVKQEWLTTLPK